MSDKLIDLQQLSKVFSCYYLRTTQDSCTLQLGLNQSFSAQDSLEAKLSDTLQLGFSTLTALLKELGFIKDLQYSMVGNDLQIGTAALCYDLCAGTYATVKLDSKNIDVLHKALQQASLKEREEPYFIFVKALMQPSFKNRQHL